MIGAPFASRERMFALDGIRGILALAIAVMHYTSYVLKGAWIGVDMFFILSGYFIAQAAATEPSIRFRTFLRNRLGRLYPMHLFSLFVFAVAMGGGWVLGATVPAYQQGYLYTFLTNVFLLQDSPFIVEGTWNSPSWFVATLFWAGLVDFFVLTRIKNANVLFLVQMFGIAFCYGYIALAYGTLDIHHTNDFGWLNLSFLRGLAGLLLGGLMWRWQGLFRFHIARRPNGVALISYAYLTILFVHFIADVDSVLFQIFVCLSSVFGLLSLAIGRSWPSVLLASRPLVWLGGISYAMYLNQYFLKGVTRYLTLDPVPSLAIYLVTLVVFSVLAERMVGVVRRSALCGSFFLPPSQKGETRDEKQ